MAEEKFKMLLHYSNGVATWNIGEERRIVYMLEVGDKSYIGSTKNARNRIKNHLALLIKNNHKNKLLQEEFDKKGTLKAFLLGSYEPNIELLNREKYYIDKMKPNCNIQKLSESRGLYKDFDSSKHLFKIGQQIAEIRKSKGLTQEQLHVLTGLDRANIAKIENGRYNTGIDIIGKIADALGVELKFEENDNL